MQKRHLQSESMLPVNNTFIGSCDYNAKRLCVCCAKPLI